MNVQPPGQQLLNSIGLSFQGLTKISPTATTTYVLTPENKHDCALSFTVTVKSASAAVTSPANYSTLTGCIPLRVSTAGPVTKVQYGLWTGNTPSLIASAPQAPWNATWDTTSLANGSYRVGAFPWDLANNAGVKSTITVTVANSSAASSVGAFVQCTGGAVC